MADDGGDDRTSSAPHERDPEAQIRSVIDHLPMAVTELDRDHRVVFVNRTALDWAGIDAEQIIGLRPPDFFPPDEWDFHRPLAETALSGIPVTARNVIETPTGERRVMEFTHNPRFGPDGAVEGYFTYASDVTERDALERRLRQSERLSALGELTGGVAHDFNNVLSVILGNAEMLALRVEGDHSAAALIAEIEAAVGRGSDLTQRLLAFARQQDLAPQVHDVNAVVRGLTGLLERALGDEVELVTAFARDARRVKIDASQLEHAILNLAINAHDAMPGGGTFTITTENVALDSVRIGPAAEPVSGDHVLIDVTDTGSGMTDDVRVKAHEPFFTTKEVGRGSGLGLSMVYGFIGQSGGQFEIDSAPGRGTSIRLYIPVA